jgi:hypothetical protein
VDGRKNINGQRCWWSRSDGSVRGGLCSVIGGAIGSATLWTDWLLAVDEAIEADRFVWRSRPCRLTVGNYTGCGRIDRKRAHSRCENIDGRMNRKRALVKHSDNITLTPKGFNALVVERRATRRTAGSEGGQDLLQERLRRFCCLRRQSEARGTTKDLFSTGGLKHRGRPGRTEDGSASRAGICAKRAAGSGAAAKSSAAARPAPAA